MLWYSTFCVFTTFHITTNFAQFQTNFDPYVHDTTRYQLTGEKIRQNIDRASENAERLGKQHLSVEASYSRTPYEYAYLKQYHDVPHPLSGTRLGQKLNVPNEKHGSHFRDNRQGGYDNRQGHHYSNDAKYGYTDGKKYDEGGYPEREDNSYYQNTGTTEIPPKPYDSDNRDAHETDQHAHYKSKYTTTTEEHGKYDEDRGYESSPYHEAKPPLESHYGTGGHPPETVSKYNNDDKKDHPYQSGLAPVEYENRVDYDVHQQYPPQKENKYDGNQQGHLHMEQYDPYYNNNNKDKDGNSYPSGYGHTGGGKGSKCKKWKRRSEVVYDSKSADVNHPHDLFPSGKDSSFDLNGQLLDLKTFGDEHNHDVHVERSEQQDERRHFQQHSPPGGRGEIDDGRNLHISFHSNIPQQQDGQPLLVNADPSQFLRPGSGNNNAAHQESSAQDDANSVEGVRSDINVKFDPHIVNNGREEDRSSGEVVGGEQNNDIVKRSTSNFHQSRHPDDLDLNLNF